MSGGGSGGSGEQKFMWNEGVAPYWEQALGTGNYLSGLGMGAVSGVLMSRYFDISRRRTARRIRASSSSATSCSSGTVPFPSANDSAQ